MSDTILIVEDDAAVAESVGHAMRGEGYEVQIAEDGPTGLAAAKSFDPKLIILDLVLPGLSNTEFIGQVRKTSGVAIIVLSVKNEEIDKVVALELGADDYVTKPFGIRELVARVNALFRRGVETHRIADEQTVFRAGAIEMDVARRTVNVDGREVYLPLKQFELLKVLMANTNRVVTRNEIIKEVWGIAPEGSTSIDVHVRWLREKIEENPSHPVYIRTVRSVGYRVVDVGGE